MAHSFVFFSPKSAIIRTAGLLISGLTLSTALVAQQAPEATPTAPVAARGANSVVDGVSIEDFRAIQVVLLEVAAADKDIAIIDAQMSALRAQRAEVNFKAAAREHPELADKLKIMLENLRERQKQEQAVAREMARQLRKQGS